MLAAFFVRDPHLIKTPSGVSGGQAGRACEIAARSDGVRGSAPYCLEGTHFSGEDCRRVCIHRNIRGCTHSGDKDFVDVAGGGSNQNQHSISTSQAGRQTGPCTIM